MIGSSIYLMASRPYIMFNVCPFVPIFQAKQMEYRLAFVNRIMKYLKGITNISIWYIKGTSVCNLVVYCDSDYAGCKIDHKRTSGTCHILGNALVSCS